jgi:hypothetical protein
MTAGHPLTPVLVSDPSTHWDAEPTRPIPIVEAPTRPIPVIDEQLLASWFGVDRDVPEPPPVPGQRHARRAAVLAVLIGIQLLTGLLVAVGLS